jgi:hypothetical protein
MVQAKIGDDVINGGRVRGAHAGQRFICNGFPFGDADGGAVIGIDADSASLMGKAVRANQDKTIVTSSFSLW